jgi:hypothetical protein
MHLSAQSIDLGKRLANRLSPIALAIGLLISVGFPATYLALGSSALHENASHYAREIAEKFRPIILEYPKLWKYQEHRYGYILEDILHHREELRRIQILDEHGRVIPGYEYASAAAAAWWDWRPPVASAPIIFSTRQVGTIQIEVSRRGLLETGWKFLLIATAVGGVPGRSGLPIPGQSRRRDGRPDPDARRHRPERQRRTAKGQGGGRSGQPGKERISRQYEP